MGDIGAPKRVIVVPEPIKAPQFPAPVRQPAPQHEEELVPELVPVKR